MASDLSDALSLALPKRITYKRKERKIGLSNTLNLYMVNLYKPTLTQSVEQRTVVVEQTHGP